MRRFKKINLAKATFFSAALVFATSAMPALVVSAQTLTGVDGNAGMNANGELVTSGIDFWSDDSTDMWALQYVGSASFDSVTLDKDNKTITFKNFVCDDSNGGSELYVAPGSDGYTYIFDGDCLISNGFSLDYGYDSEGNSDANIYISVTQGSTLTCNQIYDFVPDHLTLAEGTTSNLGPDKLVTETDAYGFETTLYKNIVFTASLDDSSSETNNNTDDQEDDTNTTESGTDETKTDDTSSTDDTNTTNEQSTDDEEDTVGEDNNTNDKSSEDASSTDDESNDQKDEATNDQKDDESNDQKDETSNNQNDDTSLDDNDNEDTANPSDETENNDTQGNEEAGTSSQAYYAAKYVESLGNLDSLIDNAGKTNEKKELYYSGGDSLPAFIIKSLMENPNVTLMFDSERADKQITRFTVNKDYLKKIFREDIEWYGPDCLSGINANR